MPPTAVVMGRPTKYRGSSYRPLRVVMPVKDPPTTASTICRFSGAY